MSSIFSRNLKIFLIAVIINYIDSTYITYSIQYDCSEDSDRRIIVSDSEKFSSLILRSNTDKTQSNQLCKVKIVDQNAIGFVVTVAEMFIKSDNCQDYLLLDNRLKWCHNNHSQSLAIFENNFNIVFNAGNSSSSQFVLIITAFNNIWNHTCAHNNEIRCGGGQQICIYNGLECDGYSNCPNGSDERDCPTPNTSKADDSVVILQNKNLEENKTLISLNINKTTKNLLIYSTLLYSKTTIRPSNQSNGLNSYPTNETSKIFTTNHKLFNNSDDMFVTTLSSNETLNSGQNLSNGEIILLVIVMIAVIILITGTTIYMYRKHYLENHLRYRLIG